MVNIWIKLPMKKYLHLIINKFMKVSETSIEGLLIIEPKIFNDQRGYFFESYNQRNFSDQGINITFVQDNQSKSDYGVIRGLHYQLSPYDQTKLVRVLVGEINDIAVDLRPESATFGKWFGINLSSENKKQLLIPGGFAHGFSVLSDYAVVLYKCDKFYNPDFEGGIKYNDQILNIDWKIPESEIIVSPKDALLPAFEIVKKKLIS